MDNKQWVAPALGLVKQIGDNEFSNEDFISTINNDKTPLGSIMSMKFGAPTTVRTLRGVPDSWVEWNVPGEMTMELVPSMVHPAELRGDERLWTPRGEQSLRIRKVLKDSGFNIRHKGISPGGIPESVEKCLKNIVYSLYIIVEKNTVASLRNKKNVSMEKNRLKRMRDTHKIISGDKRLIDLCLIASHSEPSASTIERFFYVSTLLGSSKANALITDLYEKFCGEQISSVNEAMGLIDSR